MCIVLGFDLNQQTKCPNVEYGEFTAQKRLELLLPIAIIYLKIYDAFQDGFNFIFRYIDDVLPLNNGKIYLQAELDIKDTTYDAYFLILGHSFQI